MTLVSLSNVSRQVAALMEYPELAKLAPNAFPSDVLARAEELLREIGSIGAYSHSQGVPFIRKNVVKFIEGPSHVRLIATYSPQNSSRRVPI
jgi:aspartate/methionine/tyrosine aminotransferase